MNAVEKFITNFNAVTVKDGQSIKVPHLIRISQSLAADLGLQKLLNINNDRGEFMGVAVNVVPDFESFNSYKEAFPDHGKNS